MINEFFKGFGFLFRGLTALFRVPGAWMWAIIPFFINLALLTGILWTLYSMIPGWVYSSLEWIGALAPAWLMSLAGWSVVGWIIDIVTWTVMGFLFISLTILSIYFMFLISTVVASPFNSFLAERILTHYKVIEERPFHLGRVLKTAATMLMISLVKSFIFLLLGILIAIASLIPVVNLVASFFALLIIAFDSADYSFETLEMSLSRRFGFFGDRFSQFSGSALMLGLTLLIPGLTVLVLPLSVAGSAELVALKRLEGQK